LLDLLFAGDQVERLADRLRLNQDGHERRCDVVPRYLAARHIADSDASAARIVRQAARPDDRELESAGGEGAIGVSLRLQVGTHLPRARGGIAGPDRADNYEATDAGLLRRVDQLHGGAEVDGALAL